MASADPGVQYESAEEYENNSVAHLDFFIYFQDAWKSARHYSRIISCWFGFRSPPYAVSAKRFSLPVDFL